jgi:hypothetical protein
MNPLSLITKGFLGDGRGEVINNFYYPFTIDIDYGVKNVDVLVEDIDLLVETEQKILTVETGQEDLTVEIESINVEVKLA